jgi:hypothetical protein
MLRKLWIVAALAVTGVALTPDTADAGRRQRRQARRHGSAAASPMAK